MYDFCKHKDLFGKPGEDSHKTRIPILDVALSDVAITVIAGIIIAAIFGFDTKNTIIVLFILGILIHRLFCVRTKVDRLLFSSND